MKEKLKISTLCYVYTVWKLQNFTPTVFSQIFRQINVLLKDFTVNQFDEKKIAWISRFSTLPRYTCESSTFNNFVKLKTQFGKNFVKLSKWLTYIVSTFPCFYRFYGVLSNKSKYFVKSNYHLVSRKFCTSS